LDEKEWQKLADEVKPTIKKGRPRKISKYNALQRQEIGKQASKTFKKFKNMSVVQYLIMSGKILGKTDKEIAEKLDCHRNTISNERRKLESEEWYKDIGLGVLDMAPLGLEALRVNLMQANPIVTIAFFKGLGIWTDKHEVQHKSDPATLKKKFAERVEATLGLKAKEQLEKMGVDLKKVKEPEGEN